MGWSQSLRDVLKRLRVLDEDTDFWPGLSSRPRSPLPPLGRGGGCRPAASQGLSPAPPPSTTKRQEGPRITIPTRSHHRCPRCPRVRRGRPWARRQRRADLLPRAEAATDPPSAGRPLLRAAAQAAPPPPEGPTRSGKEDGSETRVERGGGNQSGVGNLGSQGVAVEE